MTFLVGAGTMPYPHEGARIPGCPEWCGGAVAGHGAGATGGEAADHGVHGFGQSFVLEPVGAAQIMED